MKARDTDERGRLEAALSEAERARERYEFLADAATMLGESLDLETTLASVARLAVPRLGTWCAVYLTEENGELRRLAAAHEDPHKAELMKLLIDRYPISSDSRHPVRRAIASGEAVVAPRRPRGDVDRFATDEEHARILRELGHDTSMIVPLIARGQTLGAISLGPDATGQYPEWVLPTATQLARMAGLAIDNARLYRDARQAVQTRDEFLASATHDLKTPLTAISGLAQVLERRASRVPGAESDRLRGGLTKITTVTLRMTALINELMDVAQLRMGRRLALERHPTDLVRLASQTAAEAQVTTTRHKIEVESKLGSLVGNWDAFRIERVIGNLLSNAIKYSPEGGEIAIEIDQVERDGATWARLSVRDPGLGIPPQDLPRVFERFHRGRNVLGRIRGAGIGLYGSRQIVQQHGGTIGVASEEGAGSSFTVELPLDPPANVLAAEAA